MVDDTLCVRITNDFKFHPATEKTGPMHDALRDKCGELAHYIEFYVPVGREQSLALTNLEQAMFWSNAGIARNG